eukprot:403344869
MLYTDGIAKWGKQFQSTKGDIINSVASVKFKEVNSEDALIFLDTQTTIFLILNTTSGGITKIFMFADKETPAGIIQGKPFPAGIMFQQDKTILAAFYSQSVGWNLIKFTPDFGTSAASISKSVDYQVYLKNGRSVSLAASVDKQTLYVGGSFNISGETKSTITSLNIQTGIVHYTAALKQNSATFFFSFDYSQIASYQSPNNQRVIFGCGSPFSQYTLPELRLFYTRITANIYQGAEERFDSAQTMQIFFIVKTSMDFSKYSDSSFSSLMLSYKVQSELYNKFQEPYHGFIKDYDNAFFIGKTNVLNLDDNNERLDAVVLPCKTTGVTGQVLRKETQRVDLEDSALTSKKMTMVMRQMNFLIRPFHFYPNVRVTMNIQIIKMQLS